MKHKRLLAYGGLGLTLIALGVAFVKPISFSNLLIRARADMGNLSVTFNSSSSVESGSIKSTSCVLSSGLQMSGIKAYATITNDVTPQSIEIARFMAGSGSVVFSVDSPASNFRTLKSIAFTYRTDSNSGNMNIMWSSDNSSWTTISVSCGIVSQTLPSGAHYVKVVNDGGYARFDSFTLRYSCSDEPEPEKELSSISVSTAPTKTFYTEGEYLDPTGLVITRTYSDSTSDTYSYAGHTSEFSFSPSTSTALTTSDSSVTITYDGKSCSQAITVDSAGDIFDETASYSMSTTYDSKTYTLKIDFLNKLHTMIVGGETSYIHFTYVISGSNITFTADSKSGDSDYANFGRFRIFYDSSDKVNTTGTIASNNQEFSLTLYRSFAGKKVTGTYTFSIDV